MFKISVIALALVAGFVWYSDDSMERCMENNSFDTCAYSLR